MSEKSWRDLSEETHNQRENNATFWDDYMGDGITPPPHIQSSFPRLTVFS